MFDVAVMGANNSASSLCIQQYALVSVCALMYVLFLF